MEHEKKHEGKVHHSTHKRHAPKGGEDTITITKAGLWRGISGVLAILLIVSVLTGGFTGNSGQAVAAAGNGGSLAGDNAPSAAPTAAPSAAPAPAAPIDMDALIDDDTIKGDPNAPVTIVEFSDFECPFCARFYRDTLPQIQEQYIDTGKVNIVYRDFPLSFHPNAQKAGEAAECAGEQGDFWGMHDLIFEQGASGGVASFKAMAGQLGLDQDAFDSCLDNGDQAAEVQKDFRDGQAAGVTGTPGFIINGQLVAGAQPFTVFEQIIEAQLNS